MNYPKATHYEWPFNFGVNTRLLTIVMHYSKIIRHKSLAVAIFRFNGG